MKKIVVLALTILMVFSCMFVSASASEYPPSPNYDFALDGYACVDWILFPPADEGPTSCVAVVYVEENAIVHEQPRMVARRLSDGSIRYIAAGSIEGECFVLAYAFSGDDLIYGGPVFIDFNTPFALVGGSIVDSKQTIFYEDSDEIHFKPSDDLVAVLPESVPDGSLSGALKEVCALLVIALPVVACMFGIRKGIAFLISRIRGV